MTDNIGYKLLKQDWTTYKDYQWKVGEWREATGDPEQSLCTNGWLHYYRSPLLAMLHNPIHADIKNPVLVEVELDGEQKHDGHMKSGSRRMRVIREMPVPQITMAMWVGYAIYCAKMVCHDASWNKWADGWLSGQNRSTTAASAARANRTAWAAYVDSAAWAAGAAGAAGTASTARAARAAYTASTDTDIDLAALAERAVKEEADHD